MIHHDLPSKRKNNIESDDYEFLILRSTDYARLRQYAPKGDLADELDRAIVVENEQIPADVVCMHARCRYHDQEAGIQREIELVYPEEADPANGKISVLSPVGSALIGLRVGQEIIWDFPDGSERRLRVTAVQQPRE